MRQFWAALGVAALVSMGLVGCASKHTYPAPALGGVALVQEYQIVVVDPELQSNLFISRTEASYTPDGRLTAGISVQNTSKGDLRVQLRATFKDANGSPSEAQTPWVFFLVSRGANQPFSVTAMNNVARNFNIEIRRAE
jgi:hypothetical protein